MERFPFMAVRRSFFFYRHCSLIFLRNRNGVSIFLHSMEGLIQGDPLYMVTYGIGFLPLIKRLKVAYPDVTHPWYSDNAVALSTYENIELYFNLLKLFGLSRGYYPEFSKMVLIVYLDNLKSRK